MPPLPRTLVRYRSPICAATFPESSGIEANHLAIAGRSAIAQRRTDLIRFHSPSREYSCASLKCGGEKISFGVATRGVYKAS
jgi:hypothetical protein